MKANVFGKLRRLLPYFESLGTVDGLRFLIGKATGSLSQFKCSGLSHPIHLRPGTSDKAVFAQIFVKREYDIMLDFEPRVIIDGGANIGCFSVFMKNRYPNAKIIAIEPDPGNFETLARNTQPYGGIHLKQAGLWSRQTQTKIVDKYGLGNWGLVTEEVQDGAGDITMTTINALQQEFHFTHIDVLKLDIESAEKQLFSENFMSWLPQTRMIFIELHDWMQPGCARTFFTAINAALNRYTCYQLGENTIITNLDFEPAE